MTNLSGQTKVELTKGDVKINGTIIKPYFTFADFSKIIGQPNRKDLTKVTSYIYDNLGIMLIFLEGSPYIESFSIYYNDKSEFATTSSFNGSLIIGGYSIHGYTSLGSMRKIEDLFVKTDEIWPLSGVYQAAIGITQLMLIYDPSNTDKLLHIEIVIK